MNSVPQTAITAPVAIEVHDLASLPRARLDDWRALFAALPDAGFQHHPDWFAAIDAHLLPGELRVAFARDHDGPLGLLPLAGPADAREALHPRHAHLARADVLLHPRLDASAALHLIGDLAGAAAPRAEVWRIADLHGDAALAGALGMPDDSVRPARDAPLDGADETARTTRTDPVKQVSAKRSLPDGWTYRPSRPSAHFELNAANAPVPGKLRRNLARLRRRLAEAGSLRVERVRAPDALPAAWARFLAVEASGWKGGENGGTAIAHDPALVGFYGALLAPASPGLVPVIDLLWLDGDCIAVQLGLETNGVLSLLKIGYDERHAAAAPGSLLLESVLELAAADGFHRLSLVTSPPWAARWHPVERSLWHAVRYADTIGGRRRRALDDFKGFARERLRH